MSAQRHYLDHASTSPLRPEAKLAIEDAIDRAMELGDPARIHAEGKATREMVEQAREQLATLVGVRQRQIVFTSGGTEAVNTATWGATRLHPHRPVALADVEHSSVREGSRRLGDVIPIPVDGLGHIVVEGLKEVLLRSSSAGNPLALVHCQLANHEVGTLQPVARVAELCHSHGAMLHVDACSALGHLDFSIDDLGADLVSLSAHKVGGPTGAGALVLRRGLRIEPWLVGGEQERARRAGEENVIGIVGFGAAASALADPASLSQELKRAWGQTETLTKAATAVEGVAILGDPAERISNIVCFAVEGVEAEAILLSLDRRGIAAHSGSACSSESLAPSSVLLAMGADPDRSLRLSVGWSTTDADIDAFGDAFAKVVSELRSLRPSAD